MARIRTIKPEFPQSESMGRIGRESRLFFILLWTLCDDLGRTRANSRMLASLLYPYDDDAKSLLDGWLDELEREGCIKRYQVDSDHYLEICNWLSHQKIDHPSKSKIPGPREVSREFETSSIKIAQDQGPRTKDQGGGAEESEQPPLNCARRLMEILNLAQTTGFLRTVEAAIVAEAGYLDMSPADAAQQISSHAMEHRRKGLALDKFYFEDTKWRNGNGAKRQVSAVEQRVSGNREVLSDIARTIAAQRVGPDSDELKDGSGATVGRGVRAGAG